MQLIWSNVSMPGRSNPPDWLPVRSPKRRMTAGGIITLISTTRESMPQSRLMCQPRANAAGSQSRKPERMNIKKSPPLVEDFLHSEGLLNRIFSQRVITGKRIFRLHSKAISAVFCKDGLGDGYHFVIRGSLGWAKTLVPQGFLPLQRSLPLGVSGS